MFTVQDLDSRHRITTGSEKMAREYWAAILETGGTPHAVRREFGETVRITFEVA